MYLRDKLKILVDKGLIKVERLDILGGVRDVHTCLSCDKFVYRCKCHKEFLEIEK